MAAAHNSQEMHIGPEAGMTGSAGSSLGQRFTLVWAGDHPAHWTASAKVTGREGIPGKTGIFAQDKETNGPILCLEQWPSIIFNCDSVRSTLDSMTHQIQPSPNKYLLKQHLHVAIANIH